MGPPLGPPPFVPLPPLAEEPGVDPPRRRRVPVLLAAIGAVVILLVGAGTAVALVGGRDGRSSNEVATIDGGTADSESSGGSAGEVDRSELDDASLAYGECMRDHGIDLPDPQTSSGGDSGPKFSSGGQAAGATQGLDGASDEFKAAHEACKSILEDAGALIGPPSAEEQAEMQDKLIEVARCMRDKGHDMPDPQVNSDGGISISGGPPDVSDEQYQQDFEECNDAAGVTGPRLAGGRS